MSHEVKAELERLKRFKVKEDIPNDLKIAIKAFMKQTIIVGEYELDHMPVEYMENLLKTFARYPEYSETLLEMVKILEEIELIEY